MQLINHIHRRSKERFCFGQRSYGLLGVGGGKWNGYKCVGQCAFTFGVHLENPQKMSDSSHFLKIKADSVLSATLLLLI